MFHPVFAAALWLSSVPSPGRALLDSMVTAPPAAIEESAPVAQRAEVEASPSSTAGASEASTAGASEPSAASSPPRSIWPRARRAHELVMTVPNSRTYYRVWSAVDWTLASALWLVAAAIALPTFGIAVSADRATAQVAASMGMLFALPLAALGTGVSWRAGEHGDMVARFDAGLACAAADAP